MDARPSVACWQDSRAVEWRAYGGLRPLRKSRRVLTYGASIQHGRACRPEYHYMIPPMTDVEDEGLPRPACSSPATFEATLVRWPGVGGWVFAPVPDEHAPDAAGPFGRVPVVATVDGRTWSTSVWRDKIAGWLLAVPKKIRPGKDHGDLVTVAIHIDHSRL